MARRVITVFGGTGFVGRYIVKKLLEAGWVVRIPTRCFARTAKLRLMGSPGQLVPVGCDIADPDAVQQAIDGSEAVINLLGILYQRGRSNFENIHVQAAEHIARQSRDCGVKKLLHMSALAVERNPDSQYAISKYQVEKAARDAFPDAIIFRPSVIFGPEDNFLNQFATMARYFPVLPLIGTTGLFQLGRLDVDSPKFQPVYVGDVATAFVMALDNDALSGRTYELGGPHIYSFARLLRLMLQITRQNAFLLPVPFWLANIKAFFPAISAQTAPDPRSGTHTESG